MIRNLEVRRQKWLRGPKGAVNSQGGVYLSKKLWERISGIKEGGYGGVNKFVCIHMIRSFELSSSKLGQIFFSPKIR